MVFKRTLLVIAIAGALTPCGRADSASITVTSLRDDNLPIIAGGCTLRQAVESANSNVAQGGCEAGSGNEIDVVRFQSSLAGQTVTLEQGEILIESSLTIQGSANAQQRPVTLSGNTASRIFRITISPGTGELSDVTLQGLVLRRGSAIGDVGGAISVEESNLTINRCEFRENSANYGGAISLDAMSNPSIQLSIIDSVISGNTANVSGGGISQLFGDLSLTNTDVSNNFSNGNGGGVSLLGALAGLPTPLVVDGGTFSGNTAVDSGGAVFSVSQVTVDNATFSDNFGESGGAIASEGALGQLSLTDTQVLNNTAGGSGGGIATDAITVIVDSTFSGNQANHGNGGAIYQDGDLGLVSLSGSQVLGNSATDGGGLFAGRTATISGSLLSENVADEGGAIASTAFLSVSGSTFSNNTAVGAAAIRKSSLYNAVLDNVTVSTNVATGELGVMPEPVAIWSTSSIRVSNSSIIGNMPVGINTGNLGGDTWDIHNSIIADSSVVDCIDAVVPIAENVNNLIGDGSCAEGAVNLLTGSPVLAPLTDNGGATPTHLPLPGSPVVDAGNTVECTANDQTGMPRPIDGNGNGSAECDLGSIEYVDLTPPQASLVSAPDITVAGATMYFLQVTYTELDSEVDLLSVGVGDITISPGPLTVLSTALAGTESNLTVTYAVTPAGGAWDLEDNGVYSVTLNAGQVSDTATTGANGIDGGVLGSFNVLIPDGPTPEVIFADGFESL